MNKASTYTARNEDVLHIFYYCKQPSIVSVILILQLQLSPREQIQGPEKKFIKAKFLQKGSWEKRRLKKEQY